MVGESEKPPKALSSQIKDFNEHSQKQTTHIWRRQEREKSFLKVIDAI